MSMMLAAADLGIGSCHSAIGEQDVARGILGFPDGSRVRDHPVARLSGDQAAGTGRRAGPARVRRRRASRALVEPVAVIPFYGADEPELFAIERRSDGPRRARDRCPRTSSCRPASSSTSVRATGSPPNVSAPAARSSALEPVGGHARARRPAAPGPRRGRAPPVRRAPSFDGAYATWAYFFTRDWDPTPGIAELDRVVRPGGPLAIVDNLGGDAFAAMAETDISADPAFWAGAGVRVRRRSRPRSGSTISTRRGACSASSSAIAASRGAALEVPLPGRAVPSSRAAELDPAGRRPASSRGLANSLSDIPRPTAGRACPLFRRRVVRPLGRPAFRLLTRPSRRNVR